MAYDKIVAIHQPNFFPWLGYFDKIMHADTFVFLDQVAYPKSGSGAGSWVNRVKILVQGMPAWITCPIVRAHGTQLIHAVRIDDRQPWRKKLLKTLEMNYKKAGHFESSRDWLQSLILHETDMLAEYNIHSIKQIVAALGIDRHFTVQSKLGAQKASTELLVEITCKTSGSCYLCGGGSGGYQEDDKFASAGIKVKYQNFSHPYYAQNDTGSFTHGLSIIDALMHLGMTGTRALFHG